jgi:hypothetical protein
VKKTIKIDFSQHPLDEIQFRKRKPIRKVLVSRIVAACIVIQWVFAIAHGYCCCCCCCRCCCTVAVATLLFFQIVGMCEQAVFSNRRHVRAGHTLWFEKTKQGELKNKCAYADAYLENLFQIRTWKIKLSGKDLHGNFKSGLLYQTYLEK